MYHLWTTTYSWARFSYYHQPNKLVLTPELGTGWGTNLVISSLTSGELHVYGNARAHAALCSFISTDSSLNKIHVVSARYTFNGTESFLTCTTDFMHVGNYGVNISLNGIDFFSTGSEFVVVPVPVVSQVYPQVVTNGTGSIFLGGPNLVLPGNKAVFKGQLLPTMHKLSLIMDAADLALVTQVLRFPSTKAHSHASCLCHGIVLISFVSTVTFSVNCLDFPISDEKHTLTRISVPAHINVPIIWSCQCTNNSGAYWNRYWF